MRIEYHTPFGIYTTWQEAAERCERCDYDPRACVVVVRVR